MKARQPQFDLSAPMPAKSEDQIAIERILAADMREQAPASLPDRAAIVAKMRRQRELNDEAIGIKKPAIGPAAVDRMASYLERKAKRGR